MTTALAIFAKTPGISPIKTRLARTIGRVRAEQFYALAVKAVESVARSLEPDIHGYWAVAEGTALADPRWLELPAIAQGPGRLGARLHRIYDALLAQHDRVLLIGADAPQLTGTLLRDGAAALERYPYALAPAIDGGFWLMAGRAPVPKAAWQAVTYSRPDTAFRLRQRLTALGDVATLPELCDVDTAADLPPLALALAAVPRPTSEQRDVLRWLRDQPFGTSRKS